VIGIFDRSSNEQIREINLQDNSPLKGLCWSPDDRHLTVMYHHAKGDPGRGYSYVAIVDRTRGLVIDEMRVRDCPHSLRWVRGNMVVASLALLALRDALVVPRGPRSGVTLV
jgi:hypothetical protein